MSKASSGMGCSGSRSDAGQVVLDQIRTVDRSRLIKRLGQLDEATQAAVFDPLAELFAR